MSEPYLQFLREKISLAKFTGFEVPLDHERELLIRIEGLQVELQMSIWARTGDFGAHGAATRHRARMEELIKGRSAAVQARMAAERGLPA